MLFSPLRYPGGKAKLFPFFVELIKKNHLYGACYCEPYAGGAGLALKLLDAGFVEKIVINDIDRSIVAFWRSVLYNSDEFCQRIRDTPITIEEWQRQRTIWRAGDDSNRLELGFATYFLNRTNRSGIIMGAGPIGGQAQSGKWKVDARFNKEMQIKNILSLSRLSNQITVRNCDALVFLQDNILHENVIVYLDPPYYVKGKELYTNFYRHIDHMEIRDFLTKHRDARWIVSYDDVPNIRDAYSSFTAMPYYLKYSAGPKMLGTEVIFASDSLVPPDAGFLGLAA